jgi:hypothetical protein
MDSNALNAKSEGSSGELADIGVGCALADNEDAGEIMKVIVRQTTYVDERVVNEGDELLAKA